MKLLEVQCKCFEGIIINELRRYIFYLIHNYIINFQKLKK